MDDPRPKLCILTKPLVPGRNKTRLIPRFGQLRVVELARAFLLDTYRGAVALGRAEVIVALSEPGPLPSLQPKPELWLQGRGDLGARMARVARRALGKGAPWVILVGTDSPGLPKGLLVEAADALESGKKSVLGPAEDGGYYLIGLRHCPEQLFRGVPWSASVTLSETVSRLEAHGMSPQLLRPWFDVDQPGDVERLVSEILRGNIDAPASRSVLLPASPS